MKLEDLKVGQFVRFKDKRENTYIRNIKEVCNEQPHKSWGAIIIDKNANNVPYVSLKNIIKASYNIINILEVGDYVNGSKVIKIENVENYPDLSSVKIEKSDFRYGVYETVFEKDIKTIVTKEQMEQMAYKVGD